MKINIKVLNGQECSFDVHNAMTVAELKNQVFEALKVPVKDQRLFLTGRPLCDDKTLVDYPQIRDGTRLNLIVKSNQLLQQQQQQQQQPLIKTDVLEETLTKVLREHYSTEDLVKVLKEFMKEFDRTITQCSLDDYERMAKSLLNNDEQQQKSQ